MEPDDQAVEVTLKGETLNFHYKTSLDKAAQVIAFLSRPDEQVRQASPTSLPAIASSSGNAKTSPLAAIGDSGAKTYPQKIAALGLFIIHRDQRETFDAKEILSLLRRMGDTPRNYSRDLSNSELLGYVTREPNGEYFLTELGKQAVESQFAEASGISVKRKRSKKRGEKEDLAE